MQAADAGSVQPMQQGGAANWDEFGIGDLSFHLNVESGLGAATPPAREFVVDYKGAPYAILEFSAAGTAIRPWAWYSGEPRRRMDGATFAVVMSVITAVGAEARADLPDDPRVHALLFLIMLMLYVAAWDFNRGY